MCYVMWNVFTVGSLQFCNDSTIASLEANQNRLSTSSFFELEKILDFSEHKNFETSPLNRFDTFLVKFKVLQADGNRFIFLKMNRHLCINCDMILN